MKDLFKITGIKILCVALAISLLALISISVSSSSRDFITVGAEVLLTPLRSGVSYVAGEFEHLYNYMFRYDALMEENNSLKEQLSLMEEEHRSYAEVYAENERLRGLLDLQETRTDYDMEAAVIVSWTSGNYESSFIINRGSANGLHLKDFVIDQFGNAVGIVTELNESTAVVTTIIDSSVSMGAYVSDTGDSGIACGDFTRMKDGTLKMTYLPDDAELISGYSVVTSGSSGLMPEGILIGYISDMNINASGVGNYAVITPATSFTALSYVYVITGFEG